jgi:hypothetical protein
MSQELPDCEWSVARCACGHVVLRMGAVQKTFTPAQFAELHRLIQTAMEEMRISPSHESVALHRERAH